MGEFVPCEAPLFRVEGTLEKRADVVACVVLEPEPSHESDPSYVISELVDERPGVTPSPRLHAAAGHPRAARTGPTTTPRESCAW